MHTMNLQRLLCAASLAAISGSASAAAGATTADPLARVAERSGYTRTGRYEEVERLCTAYQAKWPQAVRCLEFGRTPEGRPMLALVVSRASALTPSEAAAHGLPVLLIQGG